MPVIADGKKPRFFHAPAAFGLAAALVLLLAAAIWVMNPGAKGAGAKGAAEPGIGAADGRGSFDFWSFPSLSGVPPFIADAWAHTAARKAVDSMSPEEVLSQVLMVGYPGTEAPEPLLRWIGERGLGGIKIFGWNTEDTAGLARAIAELQTKALDSPGAVPLLVATDQEGGWIRHVKGETSESPGNMAIGATQSPRDAYMTGYYLGKELAALGIMMNFAPVVDLATEPESGIIGPRAFSDDPGLAGRLGAAFAQGSLVAGVIPTAKHYPGHGATTKDSHGILPVIEIDRHTLQNRELRPFSVLIQRGIPAIMSGHLAFPNITGAVEPASLSAALIGQELRLTLGYKGLVITDDLYMTGALGGGTLLDVCVRALEAGNDMILLSTPLDVSGAVWEGLQARVRDNEDFGAAVREAAVRVMAVKLRYLEPKGKSGIVPDPETAREALPDPGAQSFFADLAKRSVSVLGSRASIPFHTRGGRILIAGPFDSFIRIGKEAYSTAEGFRFSYRPETEAVPGELERFAAIVGDYDAVIVCVANRAGLQFAGEAHAKGLPVAIVSVLSPVNVRHSAWADAVVAVYHYADICLDAGIKALRGEIPARGRIPLADSVFK